MGQRKLGRPILLPVLHGLRKRCFLRGLEVPVEGILPDNKGEFDSRQQFQQPDAPFGSAFQARWQVARLAGAGIAKAHRQNGDLRRVVEDRSINAHPGAKPLAARVVERYAGFMNPTARRLSGNQYFSIAADLEYRPWSKRQMVCAQYAGSRLSCDVVELRLGCSSHWLLNWRRGGDYSSLRSSPLRGRPSGESPLRRPHCQLIQADENLPPVWRRGWDSNPRTRLGVTHFPGVRLRPLGHLSINLQSAQTARRG